MSDRKPAPQLGGATEAFVHERASATPATQHTHGPRGATSDSPAPPLPRDGSLHGMQDWLVSAIVLPGASAQLDADAGQVLTRGPKLGAAERLEIYRYGYRARLVECLLDDYPALAHLLGYEAFEALCHEYIARHPSSAPSLNFFGRHMEAFCRQQGRAIEADLAALEWALVEVLHAPLAEALSPEALAAIAPEQWPAAQLPASQAVRVVKTEHDVNTYFQRFKTGALEEDERPAAIRSATAVYRTDMTLWRMALTPAMTGLLESLFEGATLGGALEGLADALTEDEAAEAERNVMAWFREWVAGGLFARVELPPE